MMLKSSHCLKFFSLTLKNTNANSITTTASIFSNKFWGEKFFFYFMYKNEIFIQVSFSLKMSLKYEMPAPV